MRDTMNYEEQNFGRIINVIPPHNYPQTFPLHWHKSVEIIGISPKSKLKTQPVFTIEDEIFNLNAGDFIIAWQGELHETISNNEEDVFGLQFSPSLINDMEDFYPYITAYKNIHHVVYNKDDENSVALINKLYDIVTLHTNKKDFYQTHKTIDLMEFFVLLAEYIKKNRSEDLQTSSGVNADTVRRINEASLYIQEHCDQNIGLNDVADIFGFSPSYFSRIFKQVNNVSFVECLLSSRVRHAQDLLTDQTKSITDIAYASGFNSTSTFNRAFKSIRGISPTEYRKYLSQS